MTERSLEEKPMPAIWRVPDELWEKIEPILAEHDPPKSTRRAATNNLPLSSAHLRLTPVPEERTSQDSLRYARACLCRHYHRHLQPHAPRHGRRGSRRDRRSTRVAGLFISNPSYSGIAMTLTRIHAT